MIKKPLISLLLLAVMLGGQARAQVAAPYSLEEAKKYALDKNHSAINSRKDLEIARKRIKESTSVGLPQVRGGLSYNYYFSIPTQMIPDFLTPALYGVLIEEDLVDEMPGNGETQYFPVQFGTKHNLLASFSIDQLLFSGEYIVGLRAARAYFEMVEVKHKKVESEIIQGVTNAYYAALVAQESKVILDSTLENLNGMLEETRATHKAGFIEDIDVEQIELLVADLEAMMLNVDRQLEIAYSALKFQMGLPQGNIIELTDDLGQLIAALNPDALLAKPFDHTSNIDYTLLTRQEGLQQLQLQLAKAAYLPNLSATYMLSGSAQRDEFNFLSSYGQWYPTNMLGIQLNIPIFSSGNRKYRVQQRQIELDKVKVTEEQLEQGLALEVTTAKSDLQNVQAGSTTRPPRNTSQAWEAASHLPRLTSSCSEPSANISSACIRCCRPKHGSTCFTPNSILCASRHAFPQFRRFKVFACLGIIRRYFQCLGEISCGRCVIAHLVLKVTGILQGVGIRRSPAEQWLEEEPGTVGHLPLLHICQGKVIPDISKGAVV
jgi:outer membrane protein TolC